MSEITMKIKSQSIVVAVKYFFGTLGIIAVVGLVFSANLASAAGTTFYIDATTGSDSNTGTSEASAWKTISRVEAQALAPGDQVLFKRGETWKEQLDITRNGTSASPITFGTYGSGVNPLIDGSELVVGWLQHPTMPNIWFVSWNTAPKQIFFNNQRGFQESSLSGLNASEEWTWQLSALYIYSESDPNLVYTNPGIEVPTRDRAIYINGADYIVVDGLDVTKTNGDGNILVHNAANNVWLRNFTTSKAGGNGIVFTSDNLTMQNLLVFDNGYMELTGGPHGHGIYAGNSGGYTATNWLVEGSVFDSNLRAGFHTYISDGGTFRRNIAKNNGEWGIIITSISAFQTVNVEYNIAYGNGETGLEISYLGTGTRVNALNNVLYGNTGTGIELEYNDSTSNGYIAVKNNILAENGQEDFYHTHGTAEYVIKNNLFYRSDSGVVFKSNSTTFTVPQLINYLATSGNPDSHVAESPNFVNAEAFDFHLLESSPAIDAGVSVGLSADFQGSVVPQGNAPDMGAFESPFGPPPPAEIEVFYDSFEVSEWNGLWTEDSQNDWFRSSQRAINGSRSAEVDGSANNALLISIPINLQGKHNADITFSWFIESGFDTGEYLAFEVSTNGGASWTEMARLRGNVDAENTWHSVGFSFLSIDNLRLRFKGKVSGPTEDANVDLVRVLAY